MGCRERATTDLQSLLSRSRRIGAIVRRLGGLLDSTRGESCLSGKRLRLIAPTAFWFQHDLVAVCDPGVGSWSSWHATARARPMSGCQATRSQDVCQSVNRVLPLTLTVECFGHLVPEVFNANCGIGITSCPQERCTFATSCDTGTLS